MSWLGTIEHQGWRIDIQPDLSSDEWDSLGPHLDETWDEGLGEYSCNIALVLLVCMFPDRALIATYGPKGKTPLLGDGLL